MSKRVILHAVGLLVLLASAVLIPACQTTGEARPEMLTGDTDVAHERHATGIDSHSAE